MATDAIIGGAFSGVGYAMNQARSAIRYTEAGDEFLHYGYADQASLFDDGMRSPSYATPNNGNILPPNSAANRLALDTLDLPDSYYIIRPNPGTAIQGPRPISPIIRFRPPFFRPGFGTEVRFPNGTGPGSVSGPNPL
ncbi:MAG: hypothetical protein MN733_22255 [Nitrososphaera sp.]|nr:hypothetical protein [Nitrososphaera sp.]